MATVKCTCGQFFEVNDAFLSELTSCGRCGEQFIARERAESIASFVTAEGTSPTKAHADSRRPFSTGDSLLALAIGVLCFFAVNSLYPATTGFYSDRGPRTLIAMGVAAAVSFVVVLLRRI